jgi:hypothetical protein
MSLKRNIVALLIAGIATFILWQMPSTIPSDKLPAVFLSVFCGLSIAGDLVFSKAKRDKFRQTYQALDRVNPDREHRPKPKTLIVMSLIGLVGSLLLQMPVLPYVFGGLLVILLFHSAMMRS